MSRAQAKNNGKKKQKVEQTLEEMIDEQDTDELSENEGAGEDDKASWPSGGEDGGSGEDDDDDEGAAVNALVTHSASKPALAKRQGNKATTVNVDCFFCKASSKDV